ncbi:MAG: hypothetical protein JXR82_14560 [Marinifilaceae bacterium]|nr:hypothetical protein [Marinifilaceae bacterium]
MKLFLIFLTFFLFFSCSDSRTKPSSENVEISSTGFVIDTLINDHRVKMILENSILLKEVSNEFQIVIEGVKKGDIVVYASISEGIIRLSKRPGYFQIIPKSTAKKVTITINCMEDSHMNKLGQLELKTCDDLVRVDL